jgi:putative endonuclease
LRSAEARSNSGRGGPPASEKWWAREHWEGCSELGGSSENWSETRPETMEPGGDSDRSSRACPSETGNRFAALASMTIKRQELGKFGEDLAVAELERRGYAILARRYRTRYGEIDIVARQGDTLVFVEVKAKATPGFGLAAEAMTPVKQRRLTRMAVDYVSRVAWTHGPCRFDVVAIDDAGAAPQVMVYPNAFDAVA